MEFPPLGQNPSQSRHRKASANGRAPGRVGLHPISRGFAAVYPGTTMPVAQLADPEIAAPAASRPRAEVRERETAAVPPNPPRSPALAIALGVLSAVLLVTSFILWSRVGARDDTIVQNKNRSDQVQADAVLLRAQVDQDKVATATLQKQMDEAKAASVQDKADLDNAVASAAEVQKTLDKTRILATDFQTQTEEAKVASIKHQGEVDIAQAQTAVMQIQLNKATADTSQLQTQLADLQGRLDTAQAMVAQLEKSQAKN